MNSDGSKTFHLQVTGLEHRYQDRILFHGLHFSLAPGEFLAVLGPSGCGKSTLLRILTGLLAPSAGHIVLSSRNAMVFQDPRLLPWRTVGANIRLPLQLGEGENGHENSVSVEPLLERVGLKKETAKLFPHELSGGMKMRVALARGLVTQPDVLFLDEPLSALDEPTRLRLQDELLHIAVTSAGRGHVMVTHSVSEAVYLADRIIILNEDGGFSFEWQRPPSLSKSPDARRSEEFFRLVADLSARLT